ncbi:MAG: tRNA pseudouridine(38-40) synthase TruA, partial [Planctomycetota bacterium]
LSCTARRSVAGRCIIDVSGEGFLYNMVRIIAGTLVEVGRGRIDAGAIPDILEARARAAAGPTLGPEGLCLMWTRYD